MNGASQLQRALSVFLDWRAAPTDDRPTRAELLERHADLAPLLEPMLDDETSSTDGDEDTGATRTAASGVRPDDPDPGSDGHDATDDAELPELGGDLRTLREIGRGGMGIVYEAYQASLNRRVAVKVLPELAAFHPRAVARFRREAELVARMNHPGIVDVVSVGKSRDTWYLAMELVDGVGLDELIGELRQRPDPTHWPAVEVAGLLVDDGDRERDSSTHSDAESSMRALAWSRSWTDIACEIAAQTADALQHAHDLGVVHRDVKPSNIMLRRDRRIVLMDFGLARDETAPLRTLSGEFAGTPHYVSPEQALGNSRAIGPHSDVFSLGAVLYEMLTFRRPFEAASQHELLQEIVRREPVDPRKHVAGISRDLAAVVLRALEKEPSRRYPSAAEFAADLRAAIARRPVRARHASWIERTTRWARREPMRAALAAVLVLGVPAVAGLSGYLLANRERIAAGEAKLRREDIERRLDEVALLDLYGGHERKLEALEETLVLYPDEPEVVLETLLAHYTAVAEGLRSREQAASRAVAILGERPDLLARHGCFRNILERAELRFGSSEAGELLASVPPEPSATVDRRDSSPLELRYWSAIIDLAGSQNETALELLWQAILRSERPSRRLLFRLATLADTLRDAELGRRIASALEYRNRDDDLVGAIYAATAWSAVDDGEARRRFEALVPRLPPTLAPWCEYNILTMMLRQGEFEPAIERARAAIDRLGENASLIEKLADLEAKVGDYDSAFRHFERAAELEPGRAGNWTSWTAQLLFTRQPERCLEICERAARHHPYHPKLCSNHALAYFYMGRMRDGLEWIERACASAPDSTGLQLNRASAMLELGEVDACDDLLDEIREREPDAWRAWHFEAQIARRRDDPELAVRYWREGMRHAPTNMTMLRALTAAYEDLGRPDLVRAEHERFVDADPESPRAWSELSKTMQRLAAQARSERLDPEARRTELLDEALEAADRAVRVGADTRRLPDLLLVRANAHRLADDLPAAIADLERAVAWHDDRLAELAGDDARRGSILRARARFESMLHELEKAASGIGGPDEH